MNKQATKPQPAAANKGQEQKKPQAPAQQQKNPGKK